MQKKRAYLRGLGLAAALGLSFCSTEPGTTKPPEGTDPGTMPEYGLNHDDILGNIGDVYKDGRQVPPAEGQKLHSCGKLRYATFGRVLATRGINIANMAVNSAGQLYTKAMGSWGVANFPARLPENTRNTTSGLVNLQDISLAVAEELVTAANPDGAYVAASTDCGGAATKLFNGTSCDKDGFACLLGATPTAQQLALCDNMINDATGGVTDAPTRRRLAVGALLGTINMCD